MTDVQQVTKEEDQFRNFFKTDSGVECDVYDESLATWITYHAMTGDDSPVAQAIFAHMKTNKIHKNKLKVSPSVAIRNESIERFWRNDELTRVDTIINKIEDFEIEGDSKSWRQYRVALRKWPEQEGFPIASKRPTAPDA